MMHDHRHHVLQVVPLSVQAAHDLAKFAALLGWDAVVPIMTAMAVATHRLKQYHDHTVNLLAGFAAVKILQGEAMRQQHMMC